MPPASYVRLAAFCSTLLSKMIQLIKCVVFWNFAISLVITDVLNVTLTKCHSHVGWQSEHKGDYMYTRDKTDCLLSCLLDVSFCSGVYFNEKTKFCRRMKATHILLFRSTADDVYITTPHMKVLHCEGTSKYSFNFQEASDICQNFRGRLLTESGLQDLVNQGTDYCRCGWVQNGKQGYATQGTRTDFCGPGPGVTMCNRTLANAWCDLTDHP